MESRAWVGFSIEKEVSTSSSVTILMDEPGTEDRIDSSSVTPFSALRPLAMLVR